MHVETKNMTRQVADILQIANVPARPDKLSTAYFKPFHQPAVKWL